MPAKPANTRYTDPHAQAAYEKAQRRLEEIARDPIAAVFGNRFARAEAYGQGDVLLSPPAIFEVFGVDRSTFDQRQKRGWPRLRHCSLVPIRRPTNRPGNRGGYEKMFPGSAVLEAFKPFDGLYGDPDDPRIDDEDFRREVSGPDDLMSEVTLQEWQESCPHLDGDPLEPVRDVSPVSGRPIRTFFLRIATQIKKRRADMEAGCFVDKDGVEWLSQDKVAEELGVSSWSVWRWARHLDIEPKRKKDAWYTRDQVERIRTARAADPTVIDGPDGAYPTQAPVMKKGVGKHTLRTAAGEDGNPFLSNPTGQVRTMSVPRWPLGERRATGFHEADVAELAQAPTGYTKGCLEIRGTKYYRLGQAALDFDFPAGFLRRCIRKRQWFLADVFPDGRLPTLEAKPPRRRGRREPLIAAGDMVKFRDAVRIELARTRQLEQQGWRSRQDLLSRLDEPTVQQRWSFNELFRRVRERPELPHETVLRKTTQLRRHGAKPPKKQPVYTSVKVYDVQVFERLWEEEANRSEVTPPEDGNPESLTDNASADNGADNLSRATKALPDNPDLVPLAKKIRAERDSGKSMNTIALDFTDGNEKLAASLLRQLRRYKHLLD